VEAGNTRWSIQGVYAGLNILQEGQGQVVREEEVGTEASESRLALSRREVRQNCWEQLFKELVIMDGPCNPEAEVAHPEQHVFHVELYARV
jgi:hypothetical protein